MQKYFASLTIILLAAMVVIRARMLGKRGIKAFRFGETDRKDFLIPPFVLFYFYQIFAGTFGFPRFRFPPLFRSEPGSWIGVLLCAFGTILMAASLLSFKNSFRVGIDTESPGTLITTGVFAFTRNPIYLAFWSVLLGQFLIFPNVLFLTYFLAALLIIHRQVLLEEKFLRSRYGREYEEYCNRVRRYF